jgi:tetratricopeptide (TPR) repeat protein
MPIKFLKENLNKTILIAICFVFAFIPYLLAADKVDKDAPELTSLQQQARSYRSEGIKLQELGDVENALKFYQKAADLDPAYSDVYNDLGVVYEGIGMPERAEESYIQALKVDPYFLSAYSNLALFYEGQRDLPNAAYYWKRRAELGDIDDPWTLKAEQRLADIRLSLSQDPMSDMIKSDIVDLMREITNEKYALKHGKKALVANKINNAKANYKKKNYTKAINEAFDAYYMDPSNKEAEDFIEKKTQAGALSR